MHSYQSFGELTFRQERLLTCHAQPCLALRGAENLAFSWKDATNLYLQRGRRGSDLQYLEITMYLFPP
jgi:hypothetical protein